MTNTLQITQRMIASTKLSFDGKRYWLTVRKTMKGLGLIHFVNSREVEILSAKSLCYAEHIATYGFSHQLTPDHELDEPMFIEETEEERHARFNPPLSALDIMNAEILETNQKRNEDET